MAVIKGLNMTRDQKNREKSYFLKNLLSKLILKVRTILIANNE